MLEDGLSVNGFRVTAREMGGGSAAWGAAIRRGNQRYLFAEVDGLQLVKELRLGWPFLRSS